MQSRSEQNQACLTIAPYQDIALLQYLLSSTAKLPNTKFQVIIDCQQVKVQTQATNGPWISFLLIQFPGIIDLWKAMIHLKPKIINHETEQNGKIVYVLEVTDEHNSRITKLRYSEFRQIHEELEEIVDKLKLHIILPEFPGRKLFGSTNKSEESIFERKKEINNYLIDLLSIEKLHCLDLMKKYYVPPHDKQAENSPSLLAAKEGNNDINIQICIDRYTLVEDVVIYYVRLRDLNSHEEWTFKTRYSELRNVHEALEDSKIKNLPPFPKKKIFGITNDSPENIEKRREELQKYFNQIFNSKEVLRSDAIRYFIEQSRKQANRDKQLDALNRKKKSEKV